jgi:hypothetical protein
MSGYLSFPSAQSSIAIHHEKDLSREIQKVWQKRNFAVRGLVHHQVQPHLVFWK